MFDVVLRTQRQPRLESRGMFSGWACSKLTQWINSIICYAWGQRTDIHSTICLISLRHHNLLRKYGAWFMGSFHPQKQGRLEYIFVL